MEANFNLIVETDNNSYFGVVSGNVTKPEFQIPDVKCQFRVAIEPSGGDVGWYEEEKEEGEEEEGEEEEEEERTWNDSASSSDETSEGEEPDDDGDEEERSQLAREVEAELEDYYKARRNRERCRDLEVQLASQLDKWALTLTLKLNIENLITTDDNLEPYEYEKVISADVFLKGDVLTKLHSIMLYGTVDQGRMKVKLEGKLECVYRYGALPLSDSTQEGDDIDEEEELSSNFAYHFSADLLPQLGDDGSFGYAASSLKLKDGPGSTGTTMLIDRDAGEKWGLSSVSVTVEGTASDIDREPPVTRVTGMNKRMLESGQGADMQIIGEGGIIVPCHSGVLIESPMIAAKLSGRYNNEPIIIGMKDNCKEEITAFLEFLYYDGTEKAQTSPPMAMTMYEMGHYFLLTELVKAAEGILLLKPAQWFSVDDGLELFHLGDLFTKNELQRKAVDVLGIRTNKEIRASELFPEVFLGEKLREDFLVTRKRF